MNSAVISRTYPEPSFCQREILRYAGCKEADSEILQLMDACIKEAKGTLSYRLCYRELPCSVEGEICDFGSFSVHSRDLAKNLAGCERVVAFAATVGVGLDRLIAKYGRLSPVRALMLQAIGAERIEALCDAFCRSLEREEPFGITRRFSPGYGDLPLSAQKELFSVLDCEKRIGLVLNDSLLMSPSKSVTAFVGIGSKDKDKDKHNQNCSTCSKRDCGYRGSL